MAQRHFPLSVETLKENLLKAQYNIHSGIDIEGDRIRQEIMQEHHGYDFDEITLLNWGNPQQGGAQGFITFYREIISALLNPSLIKKGAFSKDVVAKTE
jgi:hypothetical protein